MANSQKKRNKNYTGKDAARQTRTTVVKFNADEDKNLKGWIQNNKRKVIGWSARLGAAALVAWLLSIVIF